MSLTPSIGLRARRRSIRCVVDALEARRLLCSVAHSMVEDEARLDASVTSLFGSDGHIPRSVFQTLSADVQKQIDLHLIADDRPIEEQFAGQPMPGFAGGVSEGEAAQLVYPDFVPRFTGTPFVSTTYQPGRALLRFGTQINNEGLGPAVLVGGRVNSDGTQEVYQRLYNWTPGTNGTGGSFAVAQDRLAGEFIYHAAHSHLHFEGYARYELFTSVNGQPGTTAIRSDGTSVEGEKVGFCLININSSFTMSGGGSSTTIPSYSASGQPNTSCGQLQGVWVGHADVYSSSLEGQWIDITGVAPGTYFIAITIDADNAVAESNDNNNTVYRQVTIPALNPTGGVQADRFDLVVNDGPNNTFATATPFGPMGVDSVEGLTTHASFDDDFFSFQATSTGTGSVSLRFTSGDLDLFVYDSDFKEIGRATNAQNGSSASIATETVSASFVKDGTYYILARAFNESLSNNYEVRFNIKPTVAIEGIDDVADEATQSPGRISVSRNGPTSSPLTVNYTVSGSASAGSDFETLSGQIVFDVESAVKYIDIVPILDSLVEPTETVVITLSSGATFAGGGSSVTVNLRDTPPAALGGVFDRVANTYSVDFSLDVSSSLSASDLVIVAPDSTEIVPASVTWDAANRRAVFAFAQALPGGALQARVQAEAVAHAFGQTMVQDFERSFDVHRGDANGSGRVDFSDLLVLAQNYGSTSADYTRGDFDYDNDVDFDDLLILGQSYQSEPPAARSARRAGRNGSAALAADVVG